MTADFIIVSMHDRDHAHTTLIKAVQVLYFALQRITAFDGHDGTRKISRSGPFDGGISEAWRININRLFSSNLVTRLS